MAVKTHIRSLLVRFSDLSTSFVDVNDDDDVPFGAFAGGDRLAVPSAACMGCLSVGSGGDRLALPPGRWVVCACC